MQQRALISMRIAACHSRGVTSLLSLGLRRLSTTEGAASLTPEDVHDVVIVGGGMVGAALAAALGTFYLPSHALRLPSPSF